VSATPDIPADWRALLERAADFPRILVLGPPDAGKSTLCRLLADAAGARLLDSDLGQKMVGPPACVTLGRADGTLERMRFAGSTDPLRARAALLHGIASLGGADGPLVINTGGLVRGPGHPLTLATIDAAAPALVVTLGDWPERAALATARPDVELAALAPSPLARRKTDGERRAARRAVFQAHLRDAVPVTLAPEAAPPLPEGAASGLLACLADARGEDRALAQLQGWNADGLQLLAPPVEEVGKVRWGVMMLDAEGRDRPLGA